MALTPMDLEALSNQARLRAMMNVPALPPAQGYMQPPVNVIPGSTGPIPMPANQPLPVGPQWGRVTGQAIPMGPQGWSNGAGDGIPRIMPETAGRSFPPHQSPSRISYPPAGRSFPPHAGPTRTPISSVSNAGSLPPWTGVGAMDPPPPTSTMRPGARDGLFNFPAASGGKGGVFNTGVGAKLAARPKLGKPLRGPSGRLGSGLAGLIPAYVAGVARDELINRGDKTLAPNDPFRAATAGAVVGMPGGLPGVAVGGLGAGIGQLGVNALNKVATTDAARNWTSDTGDGGGLAGAALKATTGGLHETMKRLADRDAEGLSVTGALAKVPGIGSMLSAGDAPSGDGPDLAAITAQAFADAQGKAIESEDQAARAVMDDPNVIGQVGARMGMSPEMSGELMDEWKIQVQQMKVMQEQGLLVDEIEGPDGKPMRVRVDEKSLPAFIQKRFGEIVTEMPQMVAQDTAAREAAAAEEAAIAQQMQQQQLQAFGFATALDGIMAPQYAAMQSNPYMAPYAGMMQQGFLQMPYQLAAEQQQQLMSDRQNQAAQLAQQQVSQDRAYELELAKRRAAMQAELEAGSGKTSDASAQVAAALLANP